MKEPIYVYLQAQQRGIASDMKSVFKKTSAGNKV